MFRSQKTVFRQANDPFSAIQKAIACPDGRVSQNEI